MVRSLKLQLAFTVNREERVQYALLYCIFVGMLFFYQAFVKNLNPHWAFHYVFQAFMHRLIFYGVCKVQVASSCLESCFVSFNLFSSRKSFTSAFLIYLFRIHFICFIDRDYFDFKLVSWVGKLVLSFVPFQMVAIFSETIYCLWYMQQMESETCATADKC